MQKKPRKTVVVLHNIRSEHNVGSIFRTADAAGVSKIYLTGYTPAPVDRFGRKRNAIAKTALGAEEVVLWESVKNACTLLRRLAKNGFYLIAVEQAEGSVDYKKIKPREKTAFVFGNEVRGLSLQVLRKCDTTAHITMHGTKESLNVSVAAGIVLFWILDT